jgi:DNA-directed RNA polymerase subunit RPC12/RpoP
VRQLGKRVLIFTIGGSAAYEYLFPKLTTRFSDFPVVRFQDFLEDLQLVHRVDRERTVYTYMCAKCGKVFESTYKAAPRQNMYCDEHRIWRDRAPNGTNTQARELAPEPAANQNLDGESGG